MGFNNKFLQGIAYILCLTIINPVMADKTNNLQKLHINSDNLVIDQDKQQACFTGTVILWFEDMMVKTTKLKVFYKKVNNKTAIDYIVMPQKLTAKRTNTHEILIADSAKYSLDKQELVLSGNIMIQHDEIIIKTEKLVYYMKLNKVDF
ncbi:LptA/OstA family protein [Candidatus Tisiphia endosymbiont of Beris chalybata]|uniref:LptA/OstA family protein n=1 Tax=Candidatus Tisiphia endosymbiont of Beris chalybata TaxID=3066262 RepID=UPI00312CA14E